MGQHETVFTMEATPIKFGPGSVADAGWELKRLGVTRAMLCSDPGVVATGITDGVVESIRAAGIEVDVFTDIRVEPSDESFQLAADAAVAGGYDGFVGVGGGSTSTPRRSPTSRHARRRDHDYVNPPSAGAQPPGPLSRCSPYPRPAGTGRRRRRSRSSTSRASASKSGISHRYLRPRPGIVDPELTRSCDPRVIASAGLDVLCHAAESYLARLRPPRRACDPGRPPALSGLQPVTDIWSGKALEYGGAYLRRASPTIDRRGARPDVLGATPAAIAFGPAGVHIPHACSYPIAGLKHEWKPPGYPGDDRFVPHGIAVVLTAPASFRFTEPAAPERHRRAAELLTGQPVEADDHDALPRAFEELMRAVGAPTGLREIGYGEDDLPDLVAGAVKQQRLLVLSPVEIGPNDLAAILRESMVNW